MATRVLSHDLDEAMDNAGLTERPSLCSPSKTVDRLLASITSHGMTILARVDHAAAAAAVGLKLRSTEVIIFGNPRVGTLLMQVSQDVGIDLPLRAMVWEGVQGRT